MSSPLTLATLLYDAFRRRDRVAYDRAQAALIGWMAVAAIWIELAPEDQDEAKR